MNHCGTQNLETKRLILRRYVREDAAAMYKNWASDTEVTKYLLKLLSDFKTLDFKKFVIPTMNGNKSNSFGFIGELKNKAD